MANSKGMNLHVVSLVLLILLSKNKQLQFPAKRAEAKNYSPLFLQQNLCHGCGGHRWYPPYPLFSERNGKGPKSTVYFEYQDLDQQLMEYS
jgi:hypothetical protein